MRREGGGRERTFSQRKHRERKHQMKKKSRRNTKQKLQTPSKKTASIRTSWQEMETMSAMSTMSNVGECHQTNGQTAGAAKQGCKPETGTPASRAGSSRGLGGGPGGQTPRPISKTCEFQNLLHNFQEMHTSPHDFQLACHCCGCLWCR